MICVACERSFEGRGMRCPECAAEAAVSPPSARTEYRRSSSRGTRDLILAPRFTRLVAFLIDTTLFSVAVFLAFMILVIILMIAGVTAHYSGLFKSASNTTTSVVLMLVFWAIGMVTYLGAFIGGYVFFETSRWQATPGKYFLGLAVSDLNDKPITPLRSACRCLARWLFILPSILAAANGALGGGVAASIALSLATLVLGVISYPMYLFTDLRQALHDLITDCVVIEAREVPFQRVMLSFAAWVLLFIGYMVFSIVFAAHR